ncbi:MAG: hypothetical protein H6695_18300 [Deferribacteres bacterium]|nr:hypothetical protein [candidate division KSB1 bacterium]MCB9512137.1 hypothetical protein [Deferribacteres bacterium]
MNDVCIPIPRIEAQQVAEVVVNINGNRKKYNYRLESFAWAGNAPEVSSDTEARVSRLKNQIEGYQAGWELVQIYNPKPTDSHIHVLFRQRSQTFLN